MKVKYKILTKREIKELFELIINHCLDETKINNFNFGANVMHIFLKLIFTN